MEIVESILDNIDAIGRCYYPKEGNKIQIIKGLSKAYIKESLCHEIAHLIDWYISSGNQSDDVYIREKNAESIGNKMEKIVDIIEYKQHDTTELICINCKKRWIAVYPSGVLLKNIECPSCNLQGFAIKTGG